MKLTIYKKMMIGFSVIIVLLTIANAYVLFELGSVSDTAKITLTSNVQSVDISKQLQTLLYDEERYAGRYVVTRDPLYYDLFRERATLFRAYADSLNAIQPDAEESALIRKIQDVHDRFAESFVSETTRSEPVPERETPLNHQARTHDIELLHASIDQLVRLNQLAIGSSMNNVESTMRRSSNVALVLTVCTLLAAIAIAFIITRTITRPIDILIRGTEKIARGSFEPIAVSSRDEIALLADAFNDMRERLKKVNELKSDLTHQISHELRTPLQTILSAQYLLAGLKLGPLNEEQLRLLSVIRGSVDKLINFTNQFLDIAKIEAGMMEYRFSRVDPLSIIAPAVEDARLIAAARNISIAVHSRPVPEILADTEKLSQVVSNLLSNAIKYSPKGGTVDVDVRPCDTGIRIAVRDFGIGISAEELPKVFTKFYQAKNVSDSNSTGTGVGLALVKAFTEGHRGSVHAESALNMGSTFTIELPAAPDDLESARPTQDVAENRPWTG
jgi:two-component system sensor histidine kinase GlrK